MKRTAMLLAMMMMSLFSYSQDTIAPVLIDFSINPKIVDVSDSSQVVNVELSLTDDISGTNNTVSLSATFPNGTNYFGGAYLNSGNSLNGIWKGTIPVPFGMPVGFANINLGIMDAAGNGRNYNFQDLQNLGFDSNFQIINNNIQDTIPPSLIDITINPKIVDVSDSSQVVNVEMSLTDDISGTNNTISLIATFPNGTNYFGGAYLNSGNSLNGIWKGTIPVPFGMPLGFANINLGILDAAGNGRNYNFQDLKQLSFDYNFEIVYSVFRIKGTTTFDENNDGCNDQDLNNPVLKFEIKNGNYSNTYISRSNGEYLFHVLEGENIITPLIENSDFLKLCQVH